MNRSVVRSALGRCRLEVAQSPISQYPTTTPRHFSTTEDRQADDGANDKPSPPPPTSASRQRSQAAASQLGSLNSDSGSAPRPARLDARNLAASPRGPSGPKIINLRSLGRTPFAPRGGALGGARDGALRGGSGAAREGGHPRMTNAFQKFIAGDRAGAGRGGGVRGGQFSRGGDRGRGRGGGRGGGRGMSNKDKKAAKKKEEDLDKYYKLTYSEGEQDYIDADEQGVVTQYTPSATLADYSGYGPAVATDSPLGKVESAMRSMRILGGGKPFCADGYYTDDKATLKRYREDKKPVFFDDVKEKEWLEKMTGFNLEKEGIQGPDEKTKAAIIQTAIQGKYPEPKFADLRNTLEALANYHTKQDTWMPADGKVFDDKVRSLLPTSRKAAPKPATQAKA